ASAASAIGMAFRLGPALPLAVVGTVLMRRRMGDGELLLLLWAGAGTIAVLSQGKQFAYHWFIILPVVSLLSAVTIVNAREVIESRTMLRGFAAAVALAIVLVVSLPVMADNVTKEASAALLPAPAHSEPALLAQFSYLGITMAENLEVASYLASHTSASERIFSWARPELYIMANRVPASKHGYILPLVYGPPWLQEKARAELMSDLHDRKPSYLVLLARSGWYWQMIPGVIIPLDPFPDLADLVNSNYERETTIGNSAIYRCRWCYGTTR
ncbi:MAG: hypothetical protein Q8R28_12355, partial [Dehalococcoidia bacterium]|nr:hypothetical protein [Dehalococcoidia bacterium]